jgi:acetolactate synthase-1/2/3 large subunit
MGKKKSSAKALVDGLLAHGTNLAFCVPGESYLAVLDALYDVAKRLKLISCRHEAGAANMAAAYGRMTGQPGVCFVTRGPGATHASVGVHTAFQTSVPMILFIGQVPRAHRGREAFQEVDFEAMFAPLAKWIVTIDRPEDTSQIVAEAFRVALSDRPGPVVVVLPEDVISLKFDGPSCDPLTIINHAAKPTEVEKAAKILSKAKLPLIIVGGPLWQPGWSEALETLVEEATIPVVASFRSQDYFDNLHDHYAGDLGFGKNPALVERIKDADVILALGSRLGEITTAGYTLLTPPKADQKLIHVHVDQGELGKVYKPALAIRADTGLFIEALSGVAIGGRDKRQNWRRALRRDYEIWTRPQINPGDVQLGKIFAGLNKLLPPDAILSNGAGNYTGWLHRYYQYRQPGTQLGPKSGAMGFGLPAAIAAKLAAPERAVVAVAGDGCFLMAAPELATAVQYGASIIVLVINNGMYGTIRMHQELHYPGRISGTDLKNPDFAALARSFGAIGKTIRRTADFRRAFKVALKAARPTVLDIIVDPEAISTQISLSDLRKASGVPGTAAKE